MDFELTEDQNIFSNSVRKFAANTLAADSVARANSDSYPWDVAQKFGEMGLLGITIPEDTVSYTHLTLPTICSV